jgi:hypothetical protein
MKMHPLLIEPLESRIAPASLIIVNPHVATYTDSDGDHVTVKTSAGNLGTDATFTFTTAGSLAELSLGPTFTGASLAFSVVRVPGGDGLANVGYIFSGTYLGNVTVAGDLGRITASSGSETLPAVKTLTVNSLGRLGLDSQQGLTSPTLESDFNGTLGALHITHDDNGAYINVSGGNIGSIHIGGSLIGGSTEHSGEIATTGLSNIGTITIGQDIQGGSAQYTGIIDCGTTITGTVTVGGSIIGGAGSASGAIASISGGIVGPIKIGQSILGGSGEVSGVIISTNGTIGNVAVGGSLIGGSAQDAGFIETGTAGNNIGTVKIGHDMQGGSAGLTGSIQSMGSLAGVSIGGSLLGGNGVESGIVTSTGVLGPVSIGHNVIGVAAQTGLIGSNLSVTSVTIGGSLVGSAGANENNGAIEAGSGNIGPVKIGQDIIGGGGERSGTVYAQGGTIASLTVGGSILGGTGPYSGFVQALNIGRTTIGHDIVGAGVASGGLYAGGITTVNIGGSLIGGPSESSGIIDTVAGNIGSVKIARDLVGGSIGGTTASVDSSGLIKSVGSIGSITIGGSIISGTDTSTAANATLTNNASIRAALNIGSITVGGSLIGNPDGGSGNAASPVIISAAGPAVPVGSKDLAFGTITIGGRVEDAEILAGYNATLTGVNADAQIGPVKVGGDWIASDLVAGATNPDVPATGAFPNFGDGSDVKLSGAGVTDNPSIISKIASVTIGGAVFGTPASFSITDSYGFVAESIGTFRVGGVSIAIPTGNTLLAVGETGDVAISVIV